MLRLYWRARIILMALRWVFRPSIGCQVWWKGDIWTVRNGTSKPMYQLGRRDELELWHNAFVHRSQFRKVKTRSNLWGSFRDGYNFYMGYWYDIWVMDGWLPRLGPMHMKVYPRNG